MSTLLGLPLLLLGALFGGSSDDEIVKEFKRYFRKYKDTPTRVEAIMALQGEESPEVVRVLQPILKNKEPEVVRATIRVLAAFETRPPIEALLLELQESSSSQVRAGLLQVVAEGAYEGSFEAVSACLDDGDWEVRRRALQSLTKTAASAPADVDVAALLLPACSDSENAVRCAGYEALADLGSQLVLEPARSGLADSNWQVRACAIAALGRVRHRDSIGPLIERMALEEGRLREDIGRALANITGRDFGTRLDGWQRFWSTFEERFVIPTDAELERLREARKKTQENYTPPEGAVSYHGIDTPSRSIVFVIDVSGSMEQEVVDKERFADGDYPSFQRIDIVKTEMARTIEGLEPYVEFNILAFATEVKPWKKGLVKANPLNKSSAMSWIGRLEALGGSSKNDLAAAGLTGAANLEAGRTNSWGALSAALALEDPDYEVEVDTIFFLSDGKPSHGEFSQPDDILREIRAANELRQVVIHTIALGEFEKDFMRRLADQNAGTFVDLGG